MMQEELAKLVMLLHTEGTHGEGLYKMAFLGHWDDAKGRRDGRANAGGPPVRTWANIGKT